MEKSYTGLEDRVAIVTGAGRGIGRAIAQKLAEAGARIVVADIHSRNAQNTAKALDKKFGSSMACRVDVSDERSVEFLIEKTVKAFGKVDFLVNNAGIMFRTRISDISAEEWDQVIRVNLTGPFLCVKAVLPEMKKNRFGRIVNISSSAGRSVSTLGGVHYTASKAGLLGMTRALAKEVAPFGITVNAVCPGLIDTRMVKKSTSKKELEEFLESFPIKRTGKPEEVGDLVVFLCSDKASYITGASLDINGGDLMI